MEKMTRTQLSVLVSYGSPFVLLVALVLNSYVTGVRLAGVFRLLILSLSFPLGFIVGRMIYIRRSHVEILFDDNSFVVRKGGRQTIVGEWRNYSIASIVLDRYGRPDLRLYRTLNEPFVDLPISRTNARPQQFRDYVQKRLLTAKTGSPSLQVVGAA